MRAFMWGASVALIFERRKSDASRPYNAAAFDRLLDARSSRILVTVACAGQCRWCPATVAGAATSLSQNGGSDARSEHDIGHATNIWWNRPSSYSSIATEVTPPESSHRRSATVLERSVL